jgi:N-acetyl-gamma-glutamyl-phosphate reductase
MTVQIKQLKELNQSQQSDLSQLSSPRSAVLEAEMPAFVDSQSAIKTVAVVGATGYTGQELVKLLLQHEKVNIKSAVTQSKAGKSLASIYPSLQKLTDLVCQESDLKKLAEEVDLLFLALPHGEAAKQITPEILKKCKVIDLSGDFRLKDASDYETWYDFKHAHPQLLKQAVYGLPELNRKKIVGAQLVANPGCYATCSILTLAPLLMAKVIAPESIIIDAKSGVSGAGRSPTLDNHFNECNESIKAYNVAAHRHTPEIEQQLAICSNSSFCTSFTPHLVPMNRGILVTTYATLTKKISEAEAYDIYNSYYGNELFIRLFAPDDDLYTLPETRWVKGSNFCDIGMKIDQRTNRIISIGALDNLVKGAAGQAIQNMNILFDWPESSGLKQSPIFPS